MKKIAVVYWSGTGNTEAMAYAVADGVKSAGGEGAVFTPSEFDEGKLAEFDAVAFGCPAMGAEELEDGEFAPLFEACKPLLSGKTVGLFGSYGWGDGEWMRLWQDEVDACGAKRIGEGVICNEAPDDEAKEACRALGKALCE